MRKNLTIVVSALAGLLALAPLAEAETVFTAALKGSNEVPANASTATGFAILTLNDAQTSVTYHIEFSGLSAAETAAHFHHAVPGSNGSVVLGLPLGSPKDGAWAVGPTEVAWLFAHEIYMNVHTTAFPGGEIRGNLSIANDSYAAAMAGSNEVPPNGSAGMGTATLTLNAFQDLALYHIEFSGLSAAETAAHFHHAPPGSNGSVVLGLPLGTPKDGAWIITAAQVGWLLAGEIYVNVHTTAFPGGEIRGDLGPAPTGVETSPSVGLTLGQNFPNPFNPSTTIEYSLSQAGPVTLTIHDIRGRLVRTLVDGPLGAGRRSVSWDGRSDAGESLPSGVYLLRIQGGGEQQTRKLMLAK